jgi:hypothetical protein
MTTETVVVIPAEPEAGVVIDAQIADAAERVVEAAGAAVAMAEVQAAQVIAENEEDMAWLRMTVKTQAEQIEALSSTCQSMQEQLSLIPQALAATVEVSAAVAETTAETTTLEVLEETGTLEPEPTTDTPATPAETASPTNPAASDASADEKAPAQRRPARGLLRRRK